MSTNCVFPPELDDQQLLKYLDDPRANPETAEHLEKCPHCRTKVNDLEHFQKRLTRKLYRSTCPSPLELGEFHTRMLPPNQMVEIAAHVRQCPHCTQEISGLEEFLSDVPPRSGLLEPIKALLAGLVSNRTETMAVRGYLAVSRIFEVDDIVISLDVRPDSGGQLSILGLIAAGDQDQWTGATAELKQTYFTPWIASVDDLGTFTFEALYPGLTQITITSQNGLTVRTEKVNINT